MVRYCQFEACPPQCTSHKEPHRHQHEDEVCLGMKKGKLPRPKREVVVTEERDGE